MLAASFPLTRYINAIDALPFDERGNVIEFVIPGQPTAKGRARTQPVYKRDGKPLLAANGRVIMSTYTPEKTELYENRVAMAARAATGGQAPWSCPVAIEIEICVEVPASWSHKRRKACLEQLIAATKKPDLDNIEKAVLDGCNKIVYDDDCRVVRKSATKRYSATPGVAVRVKKLAMASA
jgi:Holliday junction resolvase RusA-like endonuclease